MSAEAERRARVAVVGSGNVDMIARVSRLPRAGETLLGDDFQTGPGGKGINQAAAAARLGAETAFAGRIGADWLGERLVAALRAERVDISHLVRDEESSTGVAMIFVDSRGENEIVVSPGANMRLSAADVDAAAEMIRAAQVLLLQLEVPLEAVERAADIARSAGVAVILNPAPASKLPRSLLEKVWLLTPNRLEASVLTGVDVHDEASAQKAACQLLQMGVDVVVVTLGRHGALMVMPEEIVRVPPFQAEAVDATAAGDAFNGALAVALAEGQSLHAALRFAAAAGALTTTRTGALPALPDRAEVERLLAGDER